MPAAREKAAGPTQEADGAPTRQATTSDNGTEGTVSGRPVSNHFGSSLAQKGRLLSLSSGQQR
eukprot:5609266-Prorocentrum_lima.AAC.1